jgi:hypothetical protein
MTPSHVSQNSGFLSTGSPSRGACTPQSHRFSPNATTPQGRRAVDHAHAACQPASGFGDRRRSRGDKFSAEPMQRPERVVVQRYENSAERGKDRHSAQKRNPEVAAGKLAERKVRIDDDEDKAADDAAKDERGEHGQV